MESKTPEKDKGEQIEMLRMPLVRVLGCRSSNHLCWEGMCWQVYQGKELTEPRTGEREASHRHQRQAPAAGEISSTTAATEVTAPAVISTTPPTLPPAWPRPHCDGLPTDCSSVTLQLGVGQTSQELQAQNVRRRLLSGPHKCRRALAS